MGLCFRWGCANVSPVVLASQQTNSGVRVVGRLDGKVAVITGAASGIGAGTARRFVAEGAKVVVADIQDEVAADLVSELGADNAAFHHTDVTHEDEVAGAIAAATDRWGRLDVMYNNAGFIGVTGPIEETSLDDYKFTMDVLLTGVFLGMKHAAPVMKAQGFGSIISTSSVCGVQAGIGSHIYTSAKFGVIGLTESVALELAEHNVRVNAICPGYIITQLSAGRMLSEVSPEEAAERRDKARDAMDGSQPMHRMGEPEDIAAMAVFLGSDDSEWVTGTSQIVDGGLILGKPWRKQPGAMSEARPIRLYDTRDGNG